MLDCCFFPIMNDYSLFSRQGKELIASVEEVLFAETRCRVEETEADVSSALDCVAKPTDSTISDRPKSGLTCALCQLTFESVDEQVVQVVQFLLHCMMTNTSILFRRNIFDQIGIATTFDEMFMENQHYLKKSLTL